MGACRTDRDPGLVEPLMGELEKVLDSLGCRATLIVTQFFPSAPRMRFMSASEMSLAELRVYCNENQLQRLPMLPKLHGMVWK